LWVFVWQEGIKPTNNAAERVVAALWRACVTQAVVLSREVNYCTDFLAPNGQKYVQGTVLAFKKM